MLILTICFSPQHHLTIHLWDTFATCCSTQSMMTSSNENIFRVTGHLYGEFTGDRWIPRTKTRARSFDVFFDLRLNKRLSKQSWGWWFDLQSHFVKELLPKGYVFWGIFFCDERKINLCFHGTQRRIDPILSSSEYFQVNIIVWTYEMIGGFMHCR